MRDHQHWVSVISERSGDGPIAKRFNRRGEHEFSTDERAGDGSGRIIGLRARGHCGSQCDNDEHNGDDEALIHIEQCNGLR